VNLLHRQKLNISADFASLFLSLPVLLWPKVTNFMPNFGNLNKAIRSLLDAGSENCAPHSRMSKCYRRARIGLERACRTTPSGCPQSQRAHAIEHRVKL
jgi:hypothetical protein